MEQNQMYEEEIDLKDLMYAVFKSWRMVLVVCLIIAIVIGGYKGLPALRSVGDIEEITANEEAYNESLEEYNTNLELFTREKENLENEIANKEDYMDNSILMQMNPYDVSYSSLDYYIVAETYNFSIINYYVNFARSSELYDDIIRNCNLDTDVRYLKEILTVSVDYDSNMLSIRLKYGDADKCNEIIQQVKASLDAKSKEIQSTVGEHIFKLVNESSAQSVDIDLETDKKNQLASIEALNVSLENKEAAIEALVEPTLVKATYATAIKSIIKYGIIGGVLGGFLAAAYLVFTFLASDKLHDYKRLRSRFQLKVLGDFATIKEGKFFGFIDRWLARCFGQGTNKLSKEEVVEMIATNLSLLLADGKTSNILLTGTVSEEEQKALYSKLANHSKLKNLDLQYGSNINATASTIVKAASSDAVVLIEKKNTSSISEIERELEAVKDIGKKVVGIILL